ncbi:MAG: flavodoxin family protein [Bacteroides sp.]|nr:flavodoxin family protein [Bacteroides sp.]MCM1390944.1 flavodoxin family protein [Bacteroides sp.]
MKIVIINSSPRKNGNTAKLCDAFCKGVVATATNSDITTIYLNGLNFKGCQSCFACKLRGSNQYGKCSLNDDLTPILEAVSAADCIVVASPIYLMDVNSSAKAFLERLCFSLGSYEAGYRSLATKEVDVVTIYTMNTKKEFAPVKAMDNVDMYLGHIFSTPQRLCSYNTYQFSDYSKYVVEVFDETEKAKQRETEFSKDLQKAYSLGTDITKHLLEKQRLKI